VFCVRLYRLHIAKDERYPIKFTPQQLTWLEAAEAYCARRKNRPRALTLFTELARAMWLPESDAYFQHLSDDQFNEPTIRFGILMCLREDGTFDSARNCAHKLVQLKYIIRVALFLWGNRVRDEMRSRADQYTPQW
jgi:hypothetical protein